MGSIIEQKNIKDKVTTEWIYSCVVCFSILKYEIGMNGSIIEQH